MHLEPQQRTLVCGLCRQYLPEGAAVYVYGSRAHGRQLKPFSDLDLLIDAAEPLPPAVLGDLQHAFSASDLPFRTDVTQRSAISETFYNAIRADLVRLY